MQIPTNAFSASCCFQKYSVFILKPHNLSPVTDEAYDSLASSRLRYPLMALGTYALNCLSSLGSSALSTFLDFFF